MHLRPRTGAFLLAATLTATGSCGGNVVVDAPVAATGGASTTTSTIATTTSTIATTTSTIATTTSVVTSTGCSDGTDCTQCPDSVSCYGCYASLYPLGVPLYVPLADCHRCNPCYTTCAGTASCPAGQPMPDPCDTGGASSGACAACLTCADKGSYCKGPYLACVADADCKALLSSLASCPGN